MTTKNVVIAFVAGKKANGSNLVSTGKELINYSTVIAKHDNDGNIVVSSTKYSKTTSVIQNMLKIFVPERLLVLREMGW